MSYNDLVDSFAAFKKLGIEMSDRAPDDKKLAEIRVDCLSSLLKLFNPTKNQRALMQQINFEQVRQVKVMARKFSVNRVTFFPYLVENQNCIPLLRAYGGERAEFFREMGLFPFLNNNQITAEECANMTQWEREYGIIIYERDFDK